MKWAQVTQKIARDFSLNGCFLLNRAEDLWIGDQPALTFCKYLKSLFSSKPATYFAEIRFFKYKDVGKDRSNKVIKYLAFMPLGIDGVDFHFLGLIYENQEQFQEGVGISSGTAIRLFLERGKRFVPGSSASSQGGR